MNNKQKINFAFYVSGGASRLSKLIRKDSLILINTVLVINDNAPNLKLKKLLTKKKINYVEINYEDLKLVDNEKNIHLSKLLLKKFIEYNIDYCFCFGRKIDGIDVLNDDAASFEKFQNALPQRCVLNRHILKEHGDNHRRGNPGQDQCQQQPRHRGGQPPGFRPLGQTKINNGNEDHENNIPEHGPLGIIGQPRSEILPG